MPSWLTGFSKLQQGPTANSRGAAFHMLACRLSTLSGPAMQFLRACLNPDPRQRATADELLAMPYFAGVTDVLPVDDLIAYPVRSGECLGV